MLLRRLQLLLRNLLRHQLRLLRLDLLDLRLDLRKLRKFTIAQRRTNSLYNRGCRTGLIWCGSLSLRPATKVYIRRCAVYVCGVISINSKTDKCLISCYSEQSAFICFRILEIIVLVRIQRIFEYIPLWLGCL